MCCCAIGCQNLYFSGCGRSFHHFADWASVSIDWHLLLLTYALNVTNTVVQSAFLDKLFGCLFSGYDVVTRKKYKSAGAHFQTHFFYNFLIFWCSSVFTCIWLYTVNRKKSWQYICHYNSGKTHSIFINFALL